jgi:hypothetical protein
MNERSRRDQIEAHLFQTKQKKNRQEGRGEGDLVPLSQVGMFRVFFPYGPVLLTAGILHSAHTPEGEDIFDLSPMEDFHDYAKSAVEDGIIETTDEFFEALTACRKDPSQVVYRRLSQAEIEELFPPPPKDFYKRLADYWKSPEGQKQLAEQEHLIRSALGED